MTETESSKQKQQMFSKLIMEVNISYLCSFVFVRRELLISAQSQGIVVKQSIRAKRQARLGPS